MDQNGLTETMHIMFSIIVSLNGTTDFLEVDFIIALLLKEAEYYICFVRRNYFMHYFLQIFHCVIYKIYSSLLPSSLLFSWSLRKMLCQ